jgi:hypothetical protein
MADMHQGFAFVDAGRTFTCRVDSPHRAHAGDWWWFEVSSEQHQRFAPFRALPEDTPEAVRDRIVAYYEDLLVRRAEPSGRRWQRGRAFGSSATTSATTTPAATS